MSFCDTSLPNWTGWHPNLKRTPPIHGLRGEPSLPSGKLPSVKMTASAFLADSLVQVRTRVSDIFSFRQRSQESPANFAPGLRGAKHELPSKFARLTWGQKSRIQYGIDLVMQFLFPARLDPQAHRSQVICNPQDRRFFWKLQLLSIELCSKPKMNSLCHLKCRPTCGWRFEPVLVIIEVESGHTEDPSQNICDGCWSSVVILHRRDQTERMTYHHKERLATVLRIS